MLAVIMIAFVLLLLCCRPKIHMNLISGENYLSRERTNLANSFFIVLVFFAHICQYGITPNSMERVALLLMPRGQLIVAPFLFFSGYGIMCSLMKNDGAYAKKLMTKRFPILLLNFNLAIACFWCVNTFLVGKNYSVSEILQATCAWGSLGNSAWYIFITLLSYVVIAFSYYVIGKRSHGKMIMLISITLLFALLVIERYKTGAYWVNSALCIPAGMVYSLHRNRIEIILERIPVPTLLLGIMLMLVGCQIHRPVFGLAVFGNPGCMLYALGVCLVQGCIKWQCPLPLLVWMGGNALFYLYIFQRIPMIVGAYFGWDVECRDVFIAACFLVTLLTAWLLMPLFKRIDVLLFGA